MSLPAAMEIGRTTQELLTRATAALAGAGVPSARLDASLLLAEVLGCDRAALLARSELRASIDQVDRFADLVRRRARRVPVSHLLGRREFWSLSFAVGGDVLDPRPDSESVVEAALAALYGAGGVIRMLDLGTGSGCLLLALLSELPDAHGVGIDISHAAVQLARRNAEALGLGPRAQFLVGDWGRSLKAEFDLIVANPPYIAQAELAILDPEVRCYEPALALDGGPDGLDAYRAIAGMLPQLLRRGGKLVLECGAGQAPEIEGILSRYGLRAIGRWCDLAGADRCIVAERREGRD